MEIKETRQMRIQMLNSELLKIVEEHWNQIHPDKPVKVVGEPSYNLFGGWAFDYVDMEYANKTQASSKI